jgi:hypothetical protein
MPDDAGSASALTAEIMRRFNDGFLNHDPGVFPALVAADCVIENTTPAPDGARHEGREACLALWQGIAANTAAWFELESVEAYAERAIIRWRYCWGPNPADSIRGVNLMRVENGLIVEAMGYVKGK